MMRKNELASAAVRKTMRGGITAGSGESWCGRRAEAEAHLCERAQRRGRFLKTAGLDLKQAATGEKDRGVFVGERDDVVIVRWV